MSVIFTEEDHSYKSSNQEDLIDWISVKIRDKYIVKSQHGMEIKSKKSK